MYLKIHKHLINMDLVIAIEQIGGDLLVYSLAQQFIIKDAKLEQLQGELLSANQNARTGWFN